MKEERDDRTGYDVVDQAPVGITICDPSQEGLPVVYVNDRFVELTGYDRSELVGRDWPSLQGPETSTARIAEVCEAVEAQETETAELLLYRADGEPFWSRVRVAPLCDDDGNLQKYVGFHEDVTDERRREGTLEALHGVATRLQNEGTVDAVCERTVSAAASILDFEICTVMIRDGEWLVPRAMSDQAPPDGSRKMALDHGLAGATYQSGKSTVIDEISEDDVSDPANDTYRSGMSVPIGEHGVFQVVHVEPNGFDEQDLELAELLVTHTASAIGRLERERELERQNERLESFVDVVSHDLRNPLSVVKGSLELARETGDDEHFQRARGAIDRMDQLIEDLLTLARHGEPVEDLVPVDLATLARESWTTVATADATLVVETSPTVHCHVGRIRQVLENLFRNAVEHAGEDVTVAVGGLPDGTGFYVADDGPGIPAAEREAVFQSGYSKTDGGTGLGLSIVHQCAAAHGWTVAVTESEDGGARFEFTDVEVDS
ncbi:receiver/sensor box histidine kinase [Halomicrobium zhouii]|uniref:receiver/sensor box histidine kinase n=1 Tax=Halomicrobium zhouii TaxID=767519 RepID=UPI0015A6FFFE|nr:ATP-binding protein [Halomicrobium zhouii]